MEYAQMHMEELAQLIQLQLDNGGRARLIVSGHSMHPTLRYYKDVVFLVPADRPLKKGDLILYRRKNGAYILHRIVSKPKDGAFFCSGDNQWQKEPVKQEQVMAVVDGFIRGGKTYREDHPGYRLWVGTWLALLPVRRPILALRRCLGRLRTKPSP